MALMYPGGCAEYRLPPAIIFEPFRLRRWHLCLLQGTRRAKAVAKPVGDRTNEFYLKLIGTDKPSAQRRLSMFAPPQPTDPKARESWLPVWTASIVRPIHK